MSLAHLTSLQPCQAPEKSLAIFSSPEQPHRFSGIGCVNALHSSSVHTTLLLQRARNQTTAFASFHGMCKEECQSDGYITWLAPTAYCTQGGTQICGTSQHCYYERCYEPRSQRPTSGLTDFCFAYHELFFGSRGITWGGAFKSSVTSE